MHDLDLAATHADRLLVMDRGRIAADGAPAALIGSAVIPTIFGIERKAGSWRLAGDSVLPG
jgi:iron complex transport system ATP-binding protein